MIDRRTIGQSLEGHNENAHVEKKASVEEILAIANRAAVHVERPYLDHDDLLYDEHGLPK